MVLAHYGGLDLPPTIPHMGERKVEGGGEGGSLTSAGSGVCAAADQAGKQVISNKPCRCVRWQPCPFGHHMVQQAVDDVCAAAE
jgi:hypothetical protein